MESQRVPPRESDDPPCRECKHHYVTYQAQHPWGCRAYGIASARYPAIDVREASGEASQDFERKEARP